MSELISGKSAYNLIGQGVEVQAHVEYEKGLLEWQDAKELPACDILNSRFDFRLKPRTITLNNIEVPAPFEPKEGEDCRCYYINTAFKHGFDWYHSTHHESNRVAWRTEAEIKQVIATLRSVFKPQ